MVRSHYIVNLKKSWESGTSFQSPALSQKNVRKVCHTAH